MLVYVDDLAKDGRRVAAAAQAELEPQHVVIKFPAQILHTKPHGTRRRLDACLYQACRYIRILVSRTLLEFGDSVRSLWRSVTPKRCAGMDVLTCTSIPEIRGKIIDSEDAAGTIQVRKLTQQDRIPAALPHPRIDNFVKNQ